MGKTVSANNTAVVQKGSGGVSPCFPDVCKTPTSGGPVAIPYPNVSAAEGSRTGYAGSKVKVGQKGGTTSKSQFKASSGDEAGTAAGKGVISSSDRSSMQFPSYSSKIKVKGHRAIMHVGGPTAVSSPAARKGLAAGTGDAAEEPGVNAPPPIPCGNPNCPHYTARVPATQTAQLPADKATDLLSPIVCLQCYREFAGIEPRPAATTRAATGE